MCIYMHHTYVMHIRGRRTSWVCGGNISICIPHHMCIYIHIHISIYICCICRYTYESDDLLGVWPGCVAGIGACSASHTDDLLGSYTNRLYPMCIWISACSASHTDDLLGVWLGCVAGIGVCSASRMDDLLGSYTNHLYPMGWLRSVGSIKL